MPCTALHIWLRRHVGPALQELELRLLECALFEQYWSAPCEPKSLANKGAREPRGFVRVLAGVAGASAPEVWLPANQRLSATLAALTPQLRGSSGLFGMFWSTVAVPSRRPQLS